LPAGRSMIPSTNQLVFYNHLPADELAAAIRKADMVIARSGYSTVMDLALLQKKSILIATPGQAEQEYLASHLHKNQWAFCVSQSEFSLTNALTAAGSVAYRPYPECDTSLLAITIRDFLASLARH
jgi:UDP-N-acetylglucosamine:LPS N-acetylglucosamine transferase